jgi:hypothetical protein
VPLTISIYFHASKKLTYNKTVCSESVTCIHILLNLTYYSYITVIYTIEFQKRRLPHAHILIFLKDKDKYPEPSQIDRIISAEIPDKDEDTEAFAAVENFMMHGPCGEANQKSPCMMDHNCTKHFQKKSIIQYYN